MTVRVALLNATLIMGLFSFLFGCTKKPTLDEWGLDQLKKAGNDLSKQHKIEFVLSFSTQSVAEQAAPRLRSAGFGVEVKQDGSDWRCLATKTMIPDLAALEQIHRDMDQIAASLGGRYEGWGTGAED
jgi:hypothetical protein